VLKQQLIHTRSKKSTTTHMYILLQMICKYTYTLELEQKVRIVVGEGWVGGRERPADSARVENKKKRDRDEASGGYDTHTHTHGEALPLSSPCGLGPFSEFFWRACVCVCVCERLRGVVCVYGAVSRWSWRVHVRVCVCERERERERENTY